MIIEGKIEKLGEGLARLTVTYDDKHKVIKTDLNILIVIRLMRYEGLSLIEKDVNGTSYWRREGEIYGE